MCGIAGLVGAWPPELLGSLGAALQHRGPDEAGEYRDAEAGVALAMRRLTILDVEGGRQPMSNEDGSLTLVFNGEIFNAPELRKALEARGRRFVSHHSDTECLLRLYEEHGEGLLPLLNGMFAFVVYDRRERRLFGARDPFGIKPLYYFEEGGRFAFASEPKALLRAPGSSREPDPESLHHYLSLRYVPGERSIFRGMKRLGAGCAFRYELGERRLATRRYWKPEWKDREERAAGEWGEILREELRAAVKRWTLSDVPVGCSLSGGLDSSALVGLLADSGARVKTYSLGFTGAGEQQWSELDLARRVAERWGTEHHELTLSADELLDELPAMVWHLDEPYGGGLPSWYVFRFMARDVKVGLTGTGGDELFGGYGKWRRYEQSLPSHASGPVLALKKRLARLPFAARALRREVGPFGHAMESYPLYLSDEEKRRAVVGYALDGIQATEALMTARFEDAGGVGARDGMTHVDLGTQLPEEFLLMTDRFSMAHSLEARVPFLDLGFATRALRIAPDVRTREDDLKYLLREAVRPLLPPELLRAPKRGFVLPERLWLRGRLRPLVERLLDPERLRRQGLLRPEVHRRYVLPHLQGRRDHSPLLWTLLMLQLWHVVFVERASSERPSFSWRELVR